ncbi:hypothetical protein ACWFRM_42050 [Streptomyces sp. NPDC055144]
MPRSPWHRDTDLYPHLRDAVAAWLNAPAPGRRTDAGRDRMPGYFVWLLAESLLRIASTATN